jgi:hypothetical protein
MHYSVPEKSLEAYRIKRVQGMGLNIFTYFPAIKLMTSGRKRKAQNRFVPVTHYILTVLAHYSNFPTPTQGTTTFYAGLACYR